MLTPGPFKTNIIMTEHERIDTTKRSVSHESAAPVSLRYVNPYDDDPLVSDVERLYADLESNYGLKREQLEFGRNTHHSSAYSSSSDDDDELSSDKSKLLDVERWLSSIRKQLKSLTGTLSRAYDGDIKHITFFVSNLESVALYLLELAGANSRSSIALATLRFVKMIKDPNRSIALDFTSFLVEHVLRIWQVADIQIQGYSETAKLSLNGLGAIFSGLKNVKHHSLLKKITRITHFLATYLTFHMFGVEPEDCEQRFENVMKFMHVKPLPTTFDFFDEFFEASNEIVVRFKTFITTGSLSSLFENTDEFGVWLVACDNIKNQYDEFKFGLKMFDVHSFMERTHELIEKGKEYVRLPAFPASHKRIIQDQVRSLTDIHNGIRTMCRSSMRRQNPLGILVAGDSSVGKSSFTEILFQHFAKVSTLLGKPLTAEDSMRYSRNHNDDYWSGYRNQWYILLDDVASKLPSGRGDDDPSVNELLQLVNNVVFCPNQAHLEDKGKITMQSKLVVATTNTLNLNLQHSMNHPFASARRLPITLFIKPKKQFSGPNGELKVNFSEYTCESYDDYWEITVYDLTKTGDTSRGERQMVKYSEREVFTSISSFVSWYGLQIKSHLTKEDDVTQRVETYEKAGCCPQCFGIIGSCPCELKQDNIEIQSGSYSYDLSYSMLLFANMVMLSYYFFSTLATSSRWFHFTLRGLPSEVWHNPWYRYDWCRISLNSVWRYSRYCMINSSAVVYVMCTKLNMISYKTWFGSYLRSVRDFYTKYRTSIIISGAFVVFYGIYKLSKSLRLTNTESTSPSTKEMCSVGTNTPAGAFTAQGAKVSLDVGKPPIITHSERPDVWYRENVPLEKFEFSDAMISYKGKPASMFRDLISRNMYYMKLERGDSYSDGHAIAITGSIFLTNAHFFRDKDGNTPLDRVTFFKNSILSSTVSFRGMKPYFIPNTDLVVFQVPSLPPHRSLVDYFPKMVIDKPVPGEILIKDAMGSSDVITIAGIRSEKQDFQAFGLENFEHLSALQTRDGRWTTEGDCGSVWWSQLEWGSVIHGLHVGVGKDANHNNTKYVCVPVSRTQLYEALTHFSSELKVQGSFPILSDGLSAPIALGPLHRKATIRYVENARVAVHGSFTTFVPKPRSRVGPTLIGEYLCDVTKNHRIPIVDTCGQPSFNGWKPKRHNLVDMVNTHEELDPCIIAMCVEDYRDKVISSLPKDEFALLHVLDDHTAINGAPGVSYIDGIKRGTSAGYPWRSTKRKLLLPLEGDTVTFCDDVWIRINRILRNYKNGHNARPVYVAHLKDEPTSLEKIAIHKTRVFCGAPLDYTFVVRKYMLSFVRVMQRNKFLFEAAPGTVVQSSEWTDIHSFLIHFGEDRIIAGDYKRFDKCMSPVMIRHAFSIIRDICSHGEYTLEDLGVIDCIATDTCFPLVDFFGDLMTFLGTNPSGHPLTVIINSIVNSLYMRFAWFSLKPDNFAGRFHDHVHLMTYGDDNIMGVSIEASWFNHTAISDVLSSSGVMYTMADKEQESVPFLHISQTSFLKRSFRPHDTLPFMGCPISHESISKRLTKCVKSREYFPELHAVLVMASALDDYFFDDKELFVERRKLFLHVIQHFKLHSYSPFPLLLPTWEDLEKRFLSYNEDLDKLREA
jgi:hypothetical protein